MQRNPKTNKIEILIDSFEVDVSISRKSVLAILIAAYIDVPVPKAKKYVAS
jgi:hypothetical protein